MSSDAPPLKLSYRSTHEILEFATSKYDVTFPMFSKIKVRGDEAHPLYKELTQQADAAPRWNFYKYLIDRDGRVVRVDDTGSGPIRVAGGTAS